MVRIGVVFLWLAAIPGACMAVTSVGNLEPNVWIRVAGPPPAPSGILAYSGGVLDPLNRKFLLFGGGHNDYWGNEVYALDLDQFSWRKMYEPDAKSRYTLENIDQINGKLRDSDKPFTRHTYNMSVYVPSLRGMLIWSGAGPGWKAIGTSKIPPDLWVYRYAENRWEQLRNDVPRTMGGGTCYDETRHVVWAVQGTHGGPLIHRFDPVTRDWQTFPIGGMAHRDHTFHNKLVCATDFDKLLMIGGSKGSTWLIDPNTRAAQRVMQDYRPDGKDGLAYDSRRKVAFEVGEGQWAWFDFTQRQWHSMPVASLPHIGPQGVWGRLVYDAKRDVLLLIVQSGTFICRPQLAAAAPRH